MKLVKVSGSASVLHKPGAVRLDGYRHLVYAPRQYGDGIYLEDGKASVEDVATAAAETPDYAVLADRFGTTAEHVADAIRYASEVGFLSKSE